MECQVEVLEQSFKAILPKEEAFAAAFYDRLFAAHPEVKRLFSGVDMGGQSEKLVGALAVVVENLRRPEVLEPVLRKLGKQHAGYGVKPAHYDAVGAALLGTLAAFLGSRWTSEVKTAWGMAYGAISSLMLQGATAGAAGNLAAGPPERAVSQGPRNCPKSLQTPILRL